MTPLTQQLEDKKKGCKEQIEKYDLILKCGDWIPTEFDRIKVYCPQCQAEIAILEQAIAEIENIKSQQQNDRKISLGETTLVDGMQTIVTQENISADISNLLQKQRQEIVSLIDKLPKKDIEPRDDDYGLYTEIKDSKYGLFVKVEDLELLKQQLNQPKTEK
jgi:hypothetical protein